MQGLVLVLPSILVPRPCLSAYCPCGQLDGSAHTIETAPAADVAGRLIWQDVAGRREAGKLDCVSQLGRARELDEGDVIAGEERRVIGSLVLLPDQVPPPGLRSRCFIVGLPAAPFPSESHAFLRLNSLRKPCQSLQCMLN